MDLIDFTEDNNNSFGYSQLGPNGESTISGETQSEPSVRPKIRLQNKGNDGFKVSSGGDHSLTHTLKPNINYFTHFIEETQMEVEECVRSPEMNNSRQRNEESDTPFRPPKTDHKLRIVPKKRLSLKSVETIIGDINGNHFFKSEDNINLRNGLFETTTEEKMITENDCKSCNQNKCQISPLDSIQPNSQPFRVLRRPLRPNISAKSEQKVVTLRRPKRSVHHYLAQFF